MYGGMDRSSIPEVKAADDKFINDVSNKYGSRKKAAQIWVDQGFKLYKENNLGMALRRFNQAWLLDPNYPDVYWGFSSVLLDRQKYCEAAGFMDTAFSKGPVHDAMLPDAAVVYSACVASNSNIGEKEKQTQLAKIDSLFKKALASPEVSDKYVYFNWSRAMYALKNWTSAWDKVQKYESVSGETLPKHFKETIKNNL